MDHPADDRCAIDELRRLVADSDLDVAGGTIRRSSSRFCLGVEHGDYNGTELFGVGTDRFIWMAYTPNDDGKMRLFSGNFPEEGIIEFGLGNTPKPKSPAIADTWGRFPFGVDCILRREGIEIKRGINAVILGDIPGGGMSRSASLTLNIILSLLDGRTVTARAQRGADLGQRMYAALQRALRDAEFALLIGTDCPVMTGDYLDQACRQLQTGKDLVVGPAEDGGYVLIGARHGYSELFESIPWGTAEVLQATRERAQSLGLRYAELAVLWDLDTPADLARWRTQQRQRPAAATNPKRHSLME